MQFVLYIFVFHMYTHTCVYIICHKMHFHIYNRKTCICWSKHNNSGIMLLVLGVGSKKVLGKYRGWEYGDEGHRTQNDEPRANDGGSLGCGLIQPIIHLSGHQPQNQVKLSFPIISISSPRFFYSLWVAPSKCRETPCDTNLSMQICESWGGDETPRAACWKGLIAVDLMVSLCDFFQLWNRSISRAGPKYVLIVQKS